MSVTNIILSNHLGSLQTALQSHSGGLRYLNLIETVESRRISEFLNDLPETEELPKADTFQNRMAGFTAKYIEFMARVNVRNHSWHWWAMPFTNKNPLSSSLCRDTSTFLLLTELANASDALLVVITDSLALGAQLRHWSRDHKASVLNLVRPIEPVKHFLKCYTPAGAVRAFLRTCWIWAQCRSYRPERDLRTDYLIVTTLTHPQSFSETSEYRDAYFGPLIDHLSESSYRPLVLVQMLDELSDQLKRLKEVKSSVPIVPVEACLSVWNLLVCLVQAIWLYALPPRLKGNAEIDGLDLGPLVKLAIIDARHDGDFYLNLRQYYAARGLARRVRIARCLYLYENRPWEKMLLLGIRRASPGVHFTGYQHAAITPSHINFFLGPEEADITPLPHMVLTTGKLTQEWLEREGNYRPEFFKAGCALRRSQPIKIRDISRPEGVPRDAHRVLVALGATIEEYVGAFYFLRRAFGGVEGYQMRVRPHPLISLDAALEVAQLDGVQFFARSSGSLEEDLNWAGVVIYASSTVSLEAIARGIPAVHIYLDDFLNTDPVHDWDEFRWSVGDSSELIATLQRIESIPSEKFRIRQQEGARYVSSYLTPVPSDGMRAFWGA